MTGVLLTTSLLVEKGVENERFEGGACCFNPCVQTRTGARLNDARRRLGSAFPIRKFEFSVCRFCSHVLLMIAICLVKFVIPFLIESSFTISVDSLFTFLYPVDFFARDFNLALIVKTENMCRCFFYKLQVCGGG